MTDDDMNSWLLNGPMAGISDDDPGGWQYGSHLMEGAPPSLLEDAPPLDAAPQAEPRQRRLAEPRAVPRRRPAVPGRRAEPRAAPRSKNRATRT